MRRLFCAAALLAGVLSLSVYGGAAYVYAHPQSPLVESVATIYHATRDGSVFQGVAQLTTRSCQRVLGKTPPTPAAPDHALVAPADPKPIEPTTKGEPEQFPAWVQGLDPVPAEQPEAGPSDPNIKPTPGCDHAGVEEGPCPGHEPGLSEESEPEPATMPSITDENPDQERMPYAQDAPRSSHACCCRLLGRLLGNAVAQVMQYLVSTEPGGEEESSLGSPGQPPKCVEDPDGPIQYPECPHLGGCPRCTPDPKAAAPKKQPGGQSAAPRRDSKVCPTHPQVDTTEFRPSDARNHEFDRIPF